MSKNKTIKYIKSNGAEVEVLNTFLVDEVEMSFIEYTGNGNIDLGSISVGGSVNCYGGDPVFTDPEEVEFLEVFTDFRETVESSTLTDNLNQIISIKAVIEARNEFSNIKKEQREELIEYNEKIKKLKKQDVKLTEEVQLKSFELEKLNESILNKKEVFENLKLNVESLNTSEFLTETKVISAEKSELIIELQIFIDKDINKFLREYIWRENDLYLITEHEEERNTEVYQKGQHWEHSSYTLLKSGEEYRLSMTRLVDPNGEDEVIAITVS